MSSRAILQRLRRQSAVGVVLCFLLFTISCNRTPVPHDAQPPEATRKLNAGVALLEQRKFAAAERELREALRVAPDCMPARVDLAMALAAQVKHEEALRELSRVLAAHPDEPHALYMTGLVQRARGDGIRARAALTRLVAADPHDVDARYALAQLEIEAGLAGRAIERLEPVVSAAPHFLSARYALGQALLREGQKRGNAALVARGEETIKEFQRLAGGTRVEMSGNQYGEQGRYAMALEDDTPARELPPRTLRFEVAGPRLGIELQTALARELPASLGSGVLLLDLDQDGRDDVLLPGAGNEECVARLWRNLGGGRFEEATKSSGLDPVRGPGVAVAAGDVDGDTRPDLLVGAHLLLQTAPLVFEDGTARSGLDPALLARAASRGLVDLDHDGDLDLVLTLPDGGGVEAYTNDGAGTFHALSGAGFGSRSSTVALTAADLDLDRDVDLLVSSLEGAPVLYANRRDLSFAEAPATGLPAAPGGGVAIADLDRDRAPDVLLLNLLGGGHGLFRNALGLKFERRALLPSRAPAHGAVFFDADLDGDLDLAIGDTIGLRIFRNDGSFLVTEETGDAWSHAGDVRGLAAADLDLDSDLDLVASVRGGPALVLANTTERGEAASVRIELRGKRSNRAGIGTKIEARAGRVRSGIELLGATGYLSQGPLAVTLGLGPERTVERLRLLWPSGVLQAERDLAAGTPQTITELDRKGSSCPFLWAFDGSSMRFVSDIQGGSPLGIWLGPGVRNLPDPDEWMLLPPGVAEPRDGAYDLRITESLEEIAYLDRALLRVIDAPASVSPFPNERLLLVPPFATPGLHLINSRHPLVRALDADGNDVTRALGAIDGTLAGALRRTRFRGYAEPWTLDLDFGRLGDGARRASVVLLAHGTIDFPNSTPILGASQAGIAPLLPALDILDAGSGRVVETITAAGAPAGLPKWMTLDLTGRIPESGRVVLRYRTSLDVSFDAIELGVGSPALPHRVTDVEAASADLRFAGYPTLVNPAGPKPESYRYDPPLSEETWADQEGLYTRHGDVRELLLGADDRLVVLSHGDEIALRFPTAALPPLPGGWERHLVLNTVGYAKDLDRNSALPDTVGPLPYRAMPTYPYDGPGPLADPGVRQAMDRYSTRYVRAR